MRAVEQEVEEEDTRKKGRRKEIHTSFFKSYYHQQLLTLSQNPSVTVTDKSRRTRIRREICWMKRGRKEEKNLPFALSLPPTLVNCCVLILIVAVTNSFNNRQNQ